MKPEAKNYFNDAAKALDLSDEKRDRAWSQMMALGMSPDEPTNIYLALSGKLEMAVEALEDLPAKVEAVAKRVVHPVAVAAEKQLKARLAEQKAEVETGFEDMMRNFSGTSNAVFKDLERKTSNLVALHYRSAERRDLIRQYAHIAGVVGIVAFLGLAASAWVFHGMGAAAGRAEAVRISDGLSDMATRPDLDTVLGLLAFNDDLSASINGWCGTGVGSSSRLETIDGAMKCGPFWITTPPVGTERPTSFREFWNYANAPGRGVDPLFLVLAGMGLAALGSWAARKWRGK